MNDPHSKNRRFCALLFHKARLEPFKKRMHCFCDRHPTALLTVALAAMPIGMIGAVFAVTALLSLPLLLTQAFLH